MPALAFEPQRPVEFVVTAGPGGGTDIFARTIQSIIAKYELMKAPVVVVNKGSAGGAEGFVYAAGAFGGAAFAFLFFAMLGSGDYGQAVIAVTIALLLHGAMYGPQAAFIAELFPTRIRYSGASIAYQLTSIVAGSLAPIIALALYQQEKSATPVAIYVAIACAVSGVAALLARETRGVRLEDIR